MADPCAYCVQWRPVDPDDEFGEYEPFWPDGTVVPRIAPDICASCVVALDAMFNDREKETP